MPIIVDKNIDDITYKTIKGRFKDEAVIFSYPLSTISGSTATHPDMQIHFVCDDMCVCAPECFAYYRAVLEKFGIRVIRGRLTPRNTYPDDIAYNVARVGKYVIAKVRYTEPKILEYYNKHKTPRGEGYEIINVNQGYAKCNLCIASENAVITEDPNIFSVFERTRGIDGLKIQAGGVSLGGYSHGFIGGASGLVGGTLVFCGTPNDTVIDFLHKNGIDTLFCFEGGLKDYGSIICVGGEKRGFKRD